MLERKFSLQKRVDGKIAQEVINLQHDIDIRFPLVFQKGLVHYEQGMWDKAVVFIIYNIYIYNNRLNLMKHYNINQMMDHLKHYFVLWHLMIM